MGEEADRMSVQLINQLRMAGISCDKDYLQRKLKGQMKQADRLNAKYTIVLGENELEKQEVEVKNMETGEKTLVSLSELENYLKVES